MEQELNSVVLTENQTASDLVHANLTVDSEKVLVQFEEAKPEHPHNENIRIKNGNWQLVLSSSNKDQFFETLKIDWILKAFSQPVIVLNEIIFIKAIQRDITNPLRLTRYILEREGVSDLISPKYFYKRVFCNPHIDTLVKFNAIICMLKAVKSPTKFIDNFLEPMYRYLYDEKYKIEVDKFIKAGRQLDISWSKERLIREYLDLSVVYKGTLSLPESCTLITHRRELKSEGIKMRHCIADYWKNVLNKKYFVIHMQEPEPLTFLISDFQRTRYFTFQAVSGIDNSTPTHEALCILGRSLSEESNQQFFRENSRFSNTCLGESSEIQAKLNTL